MPRRWRTWLAVGSLVVAEAVLGVLLVVNGGGTNPIPNPWRWGNGYLEPPPCSAIDGGLVDALMGPGDPAREPAKRPEGSHPARECMYERGSDELEILMTSRLTNQNGPLEIHRPGLSPLDVEDNHTTPVIKRYFDSVVIRFTVDNLDVRIIHRGLRKQPRVGDFPAPEIARQMRDGTVAIAENLAGKLAVRNKITPSRPLPGR